MTCDGLDDGGAAEQWSRWGPDEQVDDSDRNPGTKKATLCALRIFAAWQTDVMRTTVDPFDLEWVELNNQLTSFAGQVVACMLICCA